MPPITREDALSLLASQSINEIVQEATVSSATLATFRNIRMSAATSRMPVLAALPTAGFVTESDDETGEKPTTKVDWTDKELIAEEIAVIVPVHENVLADSDFDLWAQVRPLVAEEFGRVIDAAVLFGVNKPATWTDDAIVPAAIAAGNDHAAGSSGNTHADLADDVNEAFGLVEEDGFDVNVAYTSRALRRALRGMRDDNGQPIYLDNIRADRASGQIYGQDLYYVNNGAFDASAATIIVGDRSKAILGIRQDLTVKFLDQATLHMGGGELLHLAQRDMVALRFKMRVAFATAVPLTRTDSQDPYPFAVVTPAGGGT
jgi:HK97 family phage major capsid protein